MTGQNNREVGAAYEEQAAAWLMGRGWKIVERNYRCRLGEIDLITERGDTLAFVEVKYRINSSHGTAGEAVDLRKQRRIARVAEYFLVSHPWAERMNCRYDVAAFDEQGGFRYFPGAFGGM